jgi:putative sugar O-methyltransferase
MNNSSIIYNHYIFEKNKYDTNNIKNKDNMWDVFDSHFETCVQTDLINFRKNGLTCGIEVGLLQSERINIINKTILSQIYDISYSNILIRRFHNLFELINDSEFIESNIECNIGNPQYCLYEMVSARQTYKLNTNDLYNIYDIWQITRFNSHLNDHQIILEIGGGFGGLANKVLKNFKNCKYISVDLPESLILQHYYLNNLYPNKKILRYKDILDFGNIPDFDILLLPPFDLDILNYFKFDLVIQTRGFSEMKYSIIQKYFDIIQKNIKEDGILYLGGERYVTYRGEEIVKLKKYPFDDNWNIILSQPSWLATHSHDFLLKRNTNPLFKITEIIKSLPSVSPPPGPISSTFNVNKWISDNKMVESHIL